MFNINITPGKHILTGVDYYHTKLDWLEDANGVCFILDGKHYFAVEDPCDGYRSYMEIEESDKKICKRTFPPQEVFVETADKFGDDYQSYFGPADVLYIKNIEDASVILLLAEEHYDSYYPCAVCEYHPENLSINKNEQII